MWPWPPSTRWAPCSTRETPPSPPPRSMPSPAPCWTRLATMTRPPAGVRGDRQALETGRRPTTSTCSSHCARNCAGRVRSRAGAVTATETQPAQTSPSGEQRLEAAASGDLPADPELLRQSIGAHGATAPLTVLHKVIERVRAREADGCRATRSRRGASCAPTTHLALALRGSRLAVYDLRETLEALGSQTPVGMLSALQQVGDASVLDVGRRCLGGLVQRVVPRTAGRRSSARSWRARR